MKVMRLSYPSGDVLSKALIQLGLQGGSTLEVGTASFPSGVRSPEVGLHVRAAHEVSFILEGSFETESGGQTQIVSAGDIVSIPPGEPNASRALSDARVLYVMYQAADSAT